MRRTIRRAAQVMNRAASRPPISSRAIRRPGEDPFADVAAPETLQRSAK